MISPFRGRRRRRRLMSRSSGDALPAIVRAPVRQSPVIVVLNRGPNVDDRDSQAAASVPAARPTAHQSSGCWLKTGRSQIISLQINQ